MTYVRATWDPEGAKWTSGSDIAGLVIEAETLSEFWRLVGMAVPGMLAANGEAPLAPALQAEDRVLDALCESLQEQGFEPNREDDILRLETGDCDLRRLAKAALAAS